MEVPLEVRFHDVAHSAEVEADIRRRAAKLNRIYPRLVACRVGVEVPHKRHERGNVPTVTIEMSVPGHREIVVSQEPHRAKQKYADPDLQTVIRDAFEAAERRLKAFKERQRGDVKPHPEPFFGEVLELHPQNDHGFLRSKEGRELYFHRNAVLDGNFEDLRPGDKVHYVEVVGKTGPQASQVWRAADYEHV